MNWSGTYKLKSLLVRGICYILWRVSEILERFPIFIIYICHVPGKKLPEFPAEEEDVLLLLQRVTEAKRISQMVSSTRYHNVFNVYNFHKEKYFACLRKFSVDIC